MSKIIEKILADPRVDDISDERGLGDGFWIYLKPGFASDPECHTIHEDSPSACLPYLRAVQACDCLDYCQGPRCADGCGRWSISPDRSCRGCRKAQRARVIIKS